MFLDYLKQLRALGKRHFTITQAARDLKVSANSIQTASYRMKRNGSLISPAKGLYVIVPPEYQMQGCLPAEELVPILMQHLGADYYGGLLTAAVYFGASHQKPGAFQVISNKRIKHSLKFGQVRIDCIYKKSIANLPIQNITVSTGYLKISSPELTAMDLFMYSGRSGGLNHIATVVSELLEAVDPDKLIALGEYSGENAWLQRLAYMLEKIDPMDKDKAQAIIDKLADYLATKNIRYIPLAPEMPIRGFSRSKKWMLIENTVIESDL